MADQVPYVPSVLMRADTRIDFLLLRKGRLVIQSGAMRDHLAHLPKPENTCPVSALLFRRAGIRIVNE